VDMSSPSFWLILALTLVLGWVLGLMSRSGGKRWKQELAREREEHKAAIRNRDAQIEALKARTAEMERARPATAYRDHDDRADLHSRDSRIDDLDLRNRGDDAHRDEYDDRGRTVIRPSTRP
jgi:uncharacterized membrane-anchored protein YhcB (DUF1043 family)